MKAIIAVNNLGYIGLAGGLPWPPNKEDFKHFKKITMGGSLLVGWRTFQTLPNLGGRLIIQDAPRQELLETSIIEKVDWCIGGKFTYEKYQTWFTELHISHINDNTIGDTLFPDFRNLGINQSCQIFNYNF